MAFKKNPGAHYAGRSTRRSPYSRDPLKKRRIIIAVAVATAAVVLALIWGLVLKAESDALRAAEEAGEWTLAEDTAEPIYVPTPSLRAGWAPPAGQMQKAIDASYGGVVIDLGSCASPLPYAVELPSPSGLSVTQGAPSLADEVQGFQEDGLYVVGVFRVTSLDTSDIPTRTLQKGLEMTLLSLYAQAGVDDILLVGLPAGSEAWDRLAADYLTEVKDLFASLPVSTPALGVALPPTAFEGESTNSDGTPVYAGNLTPGRMLSVCDYLALDLRGQEAQTDSILRGMQYAYVRYQLRLLMSVNQPEAIALANERGFPRIFEYGK